MKKQVKGFVLGVVFMLVISNTVLGDGIKKTIEVAFNSIKLEVNGKRIDADNILYNGTTYVPLRKAAEILGKEVTWNDKTKTANIIDIPKDIVAGNPVTSNDQVITTNISIIESRIDGEFTGWEGETVFKLQNGQIWQQTSFSWKYSYKYSPAVLIYKSGYGYKMKVDGVDGEITVKQLK